MKTILFWVLFGVLALAAAEVINNVPCDQDPDSNILGETSEISVEPCAGGADGEPCTLHRGSNATITIKFTPNEAPRKLKSTIAWAKGPTPRDDITFRGMRPNACVYMPCPMKKNEENTFTATLSLGKTLPTGTYPLKVKIAEYVRRGNGKVFACQLFSIRLTDPE